MGKGIFAKIFDWNNLFISVRAVITSLIMTIYSLLYLVVAFVFGQMPAIGVMLGLVFVVGYLFLWGLIFKNIPLGKV